MMPSLINDIITEGQKVTTAPRHLLSDGGQHHDQAYKHHRTANITGLQKPHCRYLRSDTHWVSAD